MTGYTLDFRTNSRANGLEFARSVGEFTRTHIHEVAPTFSPLSWYRDQVRDFSDFPGFPNGVMSNGLISDVSSSGARVLLTGEGGDEWLGGEHTYYAEELAKCGYKALFSCLKSDVKEAGLTLTLKWFLRHGIFILLPNRLQNALRQYYRVTHDVRSDFPYWLSSEMRTKFISRRIKELDKRSEEVCAIGQREIIVCLSNAFRAIALEDAERRASRLGIELRRPFNTQWMVDYAMATPERLRRRGYTNKYTHVNALEGLMPENVLKRRTKAEFSVVFRNQLDQMGALLSWDIPVRSKGLLSCVGMERLYQEYQMKPAAGWPMWVLWTAFASELFFDEL